jgi:phosphatidylserine/phosphatidylglycerophosphate/cardiolipin synthase-like enzyme
MSHPSLTEQDIDALLRETFDDERLSRGERRALAALVTSPPELRLRVRRRSFEVARALAATAKLDLVLTWLEEVQKALTDAPPQATTESEAWFSPHQQVYTRIIHALDQTRTRADLCVFTITDDRVTTAILAAHRRGVRLRVISDNDKAHDLGSDLERLGRAGIAVRVDRTPAHMHHKFAIFDGETLLNGSYNWTRSANDENQENIVMTREPGLIRAFETEFDRCWSQSESY